MIERSDERSLNMDFTTFAGEMRYRSHTRSKPVIDSITYYPNSRLAQLHTEETNELFCTESWCIMRKFVDFSRTTHMFEPSVHFSVGPNEMRLHCRHPFTEKLFAVARSVASLAEGSHLDHFTCGLVRAARSKVVTFSMIARCQLTMKVYDAWNARADRDTA